MPDFVASTFICAPIEEVWKFHEAPDALFQLTPPAQDIRVLTHTGGIGVGARLVISVRLPGGSLINWLAAPIVRLQLRRLFRYRHAATQKCCESTMS